MVASNSTNVDQGAVSTFAVGEFAQGAAFTSWTVPSYVLSEPVRRKIDPRLAVALIASGMTMALIPEQGSLTGSWYLNLSEPVRLKPGTHASRQQFLAYVGAATQNAPNNNFAEQTSYAKYGYAWTEPVRLKPGLSPQLQPFTTSDTTPFPTSRNMGWFAPLTDPVKVKPRLQEGLQQFTAADPLPLPLQQLFPWYSWFAEPVRQKPGLGSHLQQAFTLDALYVPGTGTLLRGWYNWLNEPVRLPVGLKTHLQQTLAHEPRILPTPTVTATMAATETNADVALIGVYVYSSTTAAGATSANVSIVEVPAGDSGAVSVEGA